MEGLEFSAMLFLILTAEETFVEVAVWAYLGLYAHPFRRIATV